MKKISERLTNHAFVVLCKANYVLPTTRALLAKSFFILMIPFMTVVHSMGQSITGKQYPCQNVAETYTVNSPAGAFDFIWSRAFNSVTTQSNSHSFTFSGAGDEEISVSYKTQADSKAPVITNGPFKLTVTILGGNGFLETTASPSSICAGQSVTLTANLTTSTGKTLTYYLDYSPVSSNSTTRTLNTPGNYSFTYGAIDQCNNSYLAAPVTVTVKPNPTVTISPTGNLTVCRNSPITLTASGAQTYVWSGPNNVQGSGNIAIMTPQGVGNQVYTVNGTASNGCKSTATKTVYVPYITVSAPPKVCPGAIFTLTAANGTSYTWSPTTEITGYSDANKTGATIQPTQERTYTVSSTVSGCAVSAQATIDLISVPIVPNITGPERVCKGQVSQSYWANGNDGDVYYSWSLSSSNLGTLQHVGVANTATITFAAGATTEISAILSANAYNSCGSKTGSYTVTQNITVPPAPTAYGPTSACNGVNSSFSTSSSSGTSSWSVSPSSAGTIIPEGPYGNVQIDWSNSFIGSASVQVRKYNACGAGNLSSPISVNVVTSPSFSGAATACNQGGPTYFPVNGQQNPSNVQWTLTPSNAGTISLNGPYGASQVVWSPTFTGNATVNLKQTSTGCMAQPITVKVSPGTCPQGVNFTNNTITLTGDVITGSVPVGGNSPITYEWYSYLSNPNTIAKITDAPNSKDFELPVSRRPITYLRFPYSNSASGNYSNSVTVTPKTLVFNGSNQYAQIPNSSTFNLGTGNFTMEAWIRASASQSSYPQIMSGRTNANNGFLFGLFTNGYPFVQMGGSTGNWTCSECGDLRDGQCHYVAVTRNGPMLSFYVDGAFKQDVPAENTTRNIMVYGPIQIGRDVAAGGTYFNGSIDEVRLWNIAKTGLDLGANYRKRLAGTESGLVAYLKMNEGQGQVLTNLKSSALNGFLGATSSTEGSDPIWTDLNCTTLSYRKETPTVSQILENDTISPDQEFYGAFVTGRLAYPNPISSGKLHFGHIANSFTLSDGKGIAVLKGNNVDGLDASLLNKGIYMLEIDGKVEKVIVQ